MEMLMRVLVLILALIPSIWMESISDSVENRFSLDEEQLLRLVKRVDELELSDKILLKENEELRARIKTLEVASQQRQIETEYSEVGRTDTVGGLANEAQRHKRSKIHKRARSNLKQRAANKHNTRDVQRIRQSDNENPVAFFSTLHQHLENPGVHQTVVFDNVITNIGNAYNKYGGHFTAPVNGIYVFSTTLMAGTSAYPYHFQVMLNGTAVSSIYIENGATASQDVVLQLKQNDDVAIHSLDAGHKVYGYGYTSFSGFLLQQTYENVGIVGK